MPLAKSLKDSECPLDLRRIKRRNILIVKKVSAKVAEDCLHLIYLSFHIIVYNL